MLIDLLFSMTDHSRCLERPSSLACRKLCQSGVLRNFSFQADVSSAEELSGPLWKASVDVLAAAKPCVLGWPAFQCPDGVFPSQDKGALGEQYELGPVFPYRTKKSTW